jgi:hypothetical protein
LFIRNSLKKPRLTYTARYDVKPCELKASCVVELNKSKINGTLSSIESCRARVPQGSVLSPTLFNVHIEDLDGCVPQHLETSTHKYAKAWPYCSGRVSNSTISYSWQYCSSEIVFKKTA